MKSWMLGLLVVVSGCATTATEAKVEKATDAVALERDAQAAATLKATLAAMPRCEPGAEVGRVSVRATMCTRMACRQACCNGCGWAVRFEAKNGEAREVAAARAQELLKLTDGALDCEIAAWEQVLATESIGVDGAGCVVR